MRAELVLERLRERLEQLRPGSRLTAYELRGISPSTQLAWFRVDYLGAPGDWLYIQTSPRFAILDDPDLVGLGR